MTYRNHEGYPDPTAGEALANIRREEKLARQRAYVQIPYMPKKNNRPPRSVQRARQRENRAKGGRMA